MSELLDLLLSGMDQPQADQPDSLAEGLPVKSNLIYLGIILVDLIHLGSYLGGSYLLGSYLGELKPEPDIVVVPSEEEMQGLVDKQIGKMNGRASP
eukprot:794374-Pelagomonas_calceolata.AAC.1